MTSETRTRSSVRARLGSLSQVHKWWASKIAPLLAVTFLALTVEPLPVPEAMWRAAAMLWSACLLATAAYVVNDWFDREVDRAVGKESAVMSLRGSTVLALHLVLVLVAALPWLGLGLDPVAWVAFAAIVALPLIYSAPPLRWKTRGGLGVVADASLAHLAPTTFALAAFGAFDPDGRAAAVVVTGATLVWSAAVGVRAIVSHEIVDLEADRLAGVETWVGRAGVGTARRIGTWVVFPIEVVALSCIVVSLATFTALPLVVLVAVAVAMALARVAGAWTEPMLVMSTPDVERVLLFLFYRFWLGAAFLAGLIVVEPGYVVVAPVFVVLFLPVVRDELTSLARGTAGTVHGIAWIIYGKGIRAAANWTRHRLPDHARDAVAATGAGFAATGRGIAAGATGLGSAIAAAAGAIGRAVARAWSETRRFVYRAYRLVRRTVLARTRSGT